MVHENHIAGVTVSAFVHLGAFFLVAAGMTSFHPSPERPYAVPLKLAMFQPPQPVVQLEPETEPVVEAVAEPVHEPEAVPVTKPASPKPRIKKRQRQPPPVETATVPEHPRKPMPKNPVQRKQVARKPAAEPELRRVPETQVATVERHAMEIEPTAEDPALIKRIEQEYRSKLQAAIEANKTYPRRARRLRQQGSVVVAFVVEKNGYIMDLEVASRSDSEILDTAALQTVQKVSGLFPLPEELNRAAWRFSIPINYYLR